MVTWIPHLAYCYLKNNFFIIIEPRHEISNNVVCATSKGSDQLKYFMTVKLLTGHHLEFLSLKRGYTGSSESTLIRIPYCWKSHVAAQYISEAELMAPFILNKSPSPMIGFEDEDVTLECIFGGK